LNNIITRFIFFLTYENSYNATIFFAYIGYFQLINIVDKFVVLDNIQFTKQGWINRNKFLQNNRDKYFSIPIKKSSFNLNIIDRKISDKYKKQKILNQFYNAYQKAPYFDEIYPLLEKIISHSNKNLFKYVFHSISAICEYLFINTELFLSSSIEIDHRLKSEKKVIEICKFLKSNVYVNSSGGEKIYKKDNFKKLNINLKFLHSLEFRYKQYDSNLYVPNLSIIDVLMFNSKKIVKEKIDNNFILK